MDKLYDGCHKIALNRGRALLDFSKYLKIKQLLLTLKAKVMNVSGMQ